MGPTSSAALSSTRISSERRVKQQLAPLAKLAATVLLALGLANFVQAQQLLEFDFEYSGNHSVDFSATKGSLRIDSFADERSTDAALITSENIAGSGGYVADQAVAGLIQQALEQGFAHGNAPLVEADADYTIGGALLAVDAVTVERGGVENIQITFRTRLELSSGGRVLWSTTLFGRGRVPVEQGAKAAVEQALNRTVAELVRDDYFKMEII